MKIAILGRTEILYDTILALKNAGHLISCILTAKEAPEYTKTSEDFKQLAEELNVPFAKGAKIKDFSEFLLKSASDIGVSINYPAIIPQNVIDIFPYGILNVHGGDLPRYRGNACQAWAILNGEKKIGLCVHKMIGDELDSGDIIARDYLAINEQTKITEVLNWMRERTPSLVIEAIEKLQKNPNFFLEKQSKNPNDALRCYPLRPEDGRIIWSKRAIEILRLINAFNKPYSGAFCYFQGEKIIIWDAELVNDNENFCAIPGQITKINELYIEVACNPGKVRIKFIESNGKVLLPSELKITIRNRFE